MILRLSAVARLRLFFAFTAIAAVAGCATSPTRDLAGRDPEPLASCAPGETCIALIGDSTCQGHQSWDRGDREGWGTYIPQRFRPGVRVVNFAKSGFTAGNFLDPNESHFDPLRQEDRDHGKSRFAKVLEFRPTHVLIDLGINDAGTPGKSAEIKLEEYRRNLVQMADALQKQGAAVIFVNPHALNLFNRKDKLAPDGLGPYRDAMAAVAEEKSCLLVDLHARTQAIYQSEGPEGTRHRFMKMLPFDANRPNEKDLVHFNAEGAREAASIIVEELRKANHPLAGELR